MKKIIVSIATLGSGGAERVLSVLSKHLVERFDEVHYVLWEGGTPFYEMDNRVKIVSLPSLTGCKGTNKQIKTFRRYIRKEKPSLILSFLTHYNMLVLVSTMGLRQHVVVAERTDPQRMLSGGKVQFWLRDLLYRHAVGILTQTEYAKSCYDKKFAGKTKVFYNPITMMEEQVGAATRTVKEKLFVTVGRLEGVKDQTTMIHAFSQLHQTHPDYRLVIYGEGPMRQQLETLISSLGLANKVILAGNNSKVWDAIAPAECFLLSSEYEGMSNAMAEALCLGLPVISTKVGGATEFIKDGVNGYLVDVHDADTMAKRMCEVADNETLRGSMGKEAAKVYELLRADKISQEWVEYLDSLMA